MRKLSFFPRLAWQSVRNNRRFYVPYILTVLGTTAAFYILSALFFDQGASSWPAARPTGRSMCRAS